MSQKMDKPILMVHLDMYGDGECRHQIESMVHELDLRDNVTIHGNQPNEIVREAMEQSDIF